MKLVIAGSRGFHRPRYLKFLEEAIEEFEAEHKVVITEIVHGGNMQSADFLGWLYANGRGIKVTVFPADWEKYGKRAGPIRNTEMANYGDGLVAIWNGVSPGTRNMSLLMKARNKPTLVKVIVDEQFNENVKFRSSFPPSEVDTTIKSIKSES